MSLNPTEFKTRSLDRRTVWILGLLMVAVAAFSFLVLSHQSLRLDEAQSLWQTSHNPSSIMTIVASDVHVPVYHMLLHFWQKWFGNGVATSRDLSLLFFLATIPAVYALGSLSFSRSVALFATIMVAVSPFMNWYGSEIRMYSLMAFITVVNQYFFILLFKKRPIQKSVWVGYGVTAFIGAFTHYFFGFILIAEAVFFFAYWQLFPRGTLKRLLIVAGIILIAFGPWIYYVFSLNQLSNSEPHLAKPTSVDLFNTFSQFVFGFQDDHINTLIVSLWPLSVLLLFLALRKRVLILPDVTFFLLCAFIPIGLAFVVSIFFLPLYLTRYLILTVPSLYLLLGWIIATYARPLRIGIQYALVTAMILMSVQQVVSANTPVKENYKQATAYLNLNAGPQDAIVVSSPFTIYPVEYYYRGSDSIITLPIWNRFQAGAIPPFDPATLSQQVEQIAGDHQNLWLLLSYDQGYQSQIQQYFDAHYKRLAAYDFSPGLSLYEYQLRYDTPFASTASKSQ